MTDDILAARPRYFGFSGAGAFKKGAESLPYNTHTLFPGMPANSEPFLREATEHLCDLTWNPIYDLFFPGFPSHPTRVTNIATGGCYCGGVAQMRVCDMCGGSGRAVTPPAVRTPPRIEMKPVPCIARCGATVRAEFARQQARHLC